MVGSRCPILVATIPSTKVGAQLKSSGIYTTPMRPTINRKVGTEVNLKTARGSPRPRHRVTAHTVMVIPKVLTAMIGAARRT